MRRLGACLGLALIACGGSAEDTGPGWFHVVGMVPEPGTTDALDATVPELTFDAEADPARCGPDNLMFLGVNDDGTLAFEVDATIVFADGGTTARFEPASLLIHGARYAVVVRDRPEPCLDLQGRPLAPFAGEFEVP